MQVLKGRGVVEIVIVPDYAPGQFRRRQALDMAKRAMRNGNAYAAYAILMQIPDHGLCGEPYVCDVVDKMVRAAQATMTEAEFIKHVDSVCAMIDEVQR
jgi:hypothetical protein